MKKQSIYTTAMLSAAVLAGAAFGPSIAGAQTDEPAEPSTDTTVEVPAATQASEEAPDAGAKPEGARPDGRGKRGDKGAGVAELLGLTQDEVRAGLAEGQTVAELATAQGVDIDTVIDAILAEVNEHIQEHVEAGDITADEAAEKLASAEERVTEQVNTVRTLGEPAERGARGRPGKEALAEALGMTVDELEAAKEAGTSIQDLAEEAGVELPEQGQRGKRGGRSGNRGPQGDAVEAGDA